MKKEGKLIKISEAARILGVSIDTLRRYDASGKLKAIKPTGTRHRFYDRDIITLMAQDPFAKIWQWLTAEKPEHVSTSYYCANRAVFALHLKDAENVLRHAKELKTPASLLGAIIGEIGNNAFDHNLGNWPDEPGVYFYLDPVARKIIIADRGQGILKTLRQVRPGIKDDIEAVRTAFTEILSGRAPEDRGNGLKFVRSIIALYPIQLTLQSGDATVSIGPRSETLRASRLSKPIRGCVVTIEY